MKNPVFNKHHIREYLIYGFIASSLYMVPIILLLKSDKYENFYYIYIGSALFMIVMFFYALKLIYRPYDRRRAVSMLIAGHSATVIGVIIACLMVICAGLIFYPSIFTWVPVNEVVRNSPPTIQPHRRSSLLLMVLLATVICNFGVGSFISIIMSYAAKQDQTRDKQAALSRDLPLKRRT